MPEGPSIVILKEAASIFKGKKVLEVSGNSKENIDILLNKKVIDLKSWGKHFLICFKDVTVRIHLMLFGSYLINEEKEATPRLSLRFANGELNFYACSIKMIEEDLDEIYDWEIDVMSDDWNPKRVAALLKDHQEDYACDVLLDQQVFSGSGNIIKNEVLFRIKLHPLALIKDLPKAKQKELIKECRQYSLDFYKWKKAFELKKHWLAYKQKICPRCNIPFVIKNIGRNKRKTHYCENCQLRYN